MVNLTQVEVPDGNQYVKTVPDGKTLCPNFRAFTRLLCVHQTFACSPDFHAFMTRLSCVQQPFARSPDFREVNRLSCIPQTLVRSCSDFRAFFDVSRLCDFERTPPPRAFICCLDILASVWDLNLGSLIGRTDAVHRQNLVNKIT